MCMGGGGDGGAAEAREDEAGRQREIKRGTKRIDEKFRQFNDGYFKKQRQNFLSYATPQLQDQYGKAQRDLTFALDRSGLSNSSARAQKEGELTKLYDTNKRQVADQALDYESKARNSVEDARTNLIATLVAQGDAGAAANQAVSRAAALSQPQAYSPLADLFTSFTSGLNTQAANERAAAASGGLYKPRYNTGLFNSNNAVQVS